MNTIKIKLNNAMYGKIKRELGQHIINHEKVDRSHHIIEIERDAHNYIDYLIRTYNLETQVK